MNYIKSLFEGRIGRLHYFLGAIIYSFATGVILAVLERAGKFNGLFNLIILLVLAVVSIAYLVFSIGITVRRIHDVDQSGYLVILCFIPIIGWIYALYLLFKSGTPAPNTYGDIPKDDFMYNLFRVKNQADTNSNPSQPTTPTP